MKEINIALDNLILDPNNYRLHSNAKYIYVKEKDAANILVQKRVRKILEGENRELVQDLINSFRTNGFLKIDNILVKKLNNKYLVIEGNRRIAALKDLYEDFNDGLDIGHLSPEIFNETPVVVYNEQEESYELLMALRHVTGVKQWEDYEKSELITNLKNNYQLNENDIADRLGINKREVRRRLNSFVVLTKYKEDDDYSSYFKSSLASIFYEVMSKPNIREWLGWDEELRDFKKKNRLKRFFSWISPDEDGKSAIIQKRDDIRNLDKFIKDEEALSAMEQSRSLAEGLNQSTYYTQKGFIDNINQIKSKIGKITTSSLIDMDKKTQKSVLAIINSLEKNVKAIKAVINANKDINK